MAGIYIHIPFCSSKCHYCNFFSTVSLKHKQEVVQAIEEEVKLQRNYLAGEEVSTIYYGGGTPTILNNNELKSIHQTIIDNFSIHAQAEITVEANPDDLAQEKLEALLRMGVNRLSIGTQAFDDELLKKLNRRHTAADAIGAVERAKATGFQNISIDLIYGIPGLSNTAWQEEIHRAIALNINHISAYHLTVEPGTALDVLIRKKKYPQLNEALGMEQFDILIETLEHANFEHYEISNFAKAKRYSIHNTNYWKQKKYLGLGPSAHSYNLISRQWNVANLIQYYQGILHKNATIEKEILTETNQYNEYVMLALRTIWGIDFKVIQNQYPRYSQSFIAVVKEFIHKEYIQERKGKYTLTKLGKKFADGIAAAFFEEEGLG